MLTMSTQTEYTPCFAHEAGAGELSLISGRSLDGPQIGAIFVAADRSGKAGRGLGLRLVLRLFYEEDPTVADHLPDSAEEAVEVLRDHGYQLRSPIELIAALTAGR